MPHDSEIPLLVSYSRRIFTQVYQEKFISTLFVMAKKKKNWKETKWTSGIKWRKKLFTELDSAKMKINEAELNVNMKEP